MACRERTDPGPQHDQHADQTNDDRRPPLRPHFFPEQGYGERGDQKRGRKQEGIDFGQGQPCEGEKTGRHGHQRQAGAQQHQKRAARPEVVYRPIGQHRHGKRHKGEQDREKEDLEDRIGLAQGLDDRVMGGENRKGDQGKEQTFERCGHADRLSASVIKSGRARCRAAVSEREEVRRRFGTRCSECVIRKVGRSKGRIAAPDRNPGAQPRLSVIRQTPWQLPRSQALLRPVWGLQTEHSIPSAHSRPPC